MQQKPTWNYIEAYYELNGNLGGNCDKYWKALRARAGMSTDYQKTINNTDISKEKQDWGSYSAGQQINTTLYNIRRERRVELVSEGFRMADLKRWRALDQVKDVHVQGNFKFFGDSMYQTVYKPSSRRRCNPNSPNNTFRIWRNRQDSQYFSKIRPIRRRKIFITLS